MQQDDTARWQRFQGRQQIVETHAVGGIVVPGVSADVKSSPFKNGDMVFPRRVADPHARIREIALQEIGAHFQRARAAQCLDRRHSLLLENRMVSPKQQWRDSMTIGI